MKSRGGQKENFEPRSSCPSCKSWWDEKIEEIAAMFILFLRPNAQHTDGIRRSKGLLWEAGRGKK